MPAIRPVLATTTVLLLLAAIGLSCPQDYREPHPPDQFFSGTVAELAEDALTVTRSVLGKRPVVRKFSVTPETLVEGEVRPRVRVTVRYVSEDQGDRAVHIIVRGKRNTR